jgi:hypothetical protein
MLLPCPIAKLQDQRLGLQLGRAIPTISLLLAPTGMLGCFRIANSFHRKLGSSGRSLIGQLRFTIFLKDLVIPRLEKVLIDLIIFQTETISFDALSTQVAVTGTTSGEETKS